MCLFMSVFLGNIIVFISRNDCNFFYQSIIVLAFLLLLLFLIIIVLTQLD